VGCANSEARPDSLAPGGTGDASADANADGDSHTGGDAATGTGGASTNDAGGDAATGTGGSTTNDASGLSAGDARSASTLFVSPDGQGTSCSEAQPCMLTTARDHARTVTQRNGPLTIQLKGGTYALLTTFQLVESATVHDSGQPGSPTIYEAAPGETPVLSGGRVVGGWSLFDQANGIYHAKVDPSLRTRQLYVNGIRATRARGPESPPGFTLTDTGIKAPDTTFATYRAPTQLEAILNAQWRTIRCGVSAVTGTNLTLDQPCWDNANLTKQSPGGGWPPRSVFWFENAYELLDEPGEDPQPAHSRRYV
jgi:hypothetical protein